MDTVRFFPTRDNISDTVTLSDSGNTFTDLSWVTRCKIILDGTGTTPEIDSSATPAVFDWTTNSAQKQMVLKIGLSALPMGSWDARLVIYGSNTPNGRPFGEVFKLVGESEV